MTLLQIIYLKGSRNLIVGAHRSLPHQQRPPESIYMLFVAHTSIWLDNKWLAIVKGTLIAKYLESLTSLSNQYQVIAAYKMYKNESI